MVVNVGLTFFIGGGLGWIVVKIFKPKPYQEGLVMATCSSGKCSIFGSFSSLSYSSKFVACSSSNGKSG